MQRKSWGWRLYLGLMIFLSTRSVAALVHPEHPLALFQAIIGLVAVVGLLAYVNGMHGGSMMFWRVFTFIFACDQVLMIGTIVHAAISDRHHVTTTLVAGSVLAAGFMVLLVGPMILACFRLGGMFVPERDRPKDYQTIFA